MARDVSGRAAMNIAEALILALVEAEVISAAKITMALEVLVDHHNNLSRDEDISMDDRKYHREIADTISDLVRGTNLQAAQRSDERPALA